MKKRSLSLILVVFSLVLVWSFFAGLPTVRAGSDKAELVKLGQPLYEVPDQMKDQWDLVQNRVYKEYDVCLEHCANDSGCFDRCAEVYKARLDREYDKLIME